MLIIMEPKHERNMIERLIAIFAQNIVRTYKDAFHDFVSRFLV